MPQQSASFPAARPRIVVTYQREDTEARAQKLIQALGLRFGAGAVKSFYDLPPSGLLSAGGPVFLVVLVGKKWADLTKGRGPDPDAARAVETLTAALSPLLEIIPVLVGGAPMPEGTNISHLSPRSLPLRDARWEEDVETLAERLGRAGAARPRGGRAADDSVPVSLRREVAVELINALSVYLGSAQEAFAGKKMGKGKGGGKALKYGGGNGGPGKPPGGGKALRGGAAGEDRSRDLNASPPFHKKNPADVVSCGVFSPPQVSPGAKFLIQVFAHLPEEAEQAARLAKQAVKDAEKLGSKTLDAEVERGTKLSFDLSLPGLLIDDPSQHLTWRGRPEAVQFGVTVEKTRQPGNVIGTVRVSQDGVPFGHVKFQLTVAAAAPAPQPRDAGAWVRYKKAFVSYASKDRAEVLKRAQMLARLVPDFFLDFVKLEPGQRWAKGLYKQIDDSDVFFLFWSTAAKRSRWVMREVDYALDRKGGDGEAPPEIIPMVIEGPPPVKPPRRLSHLHFNDMFLYFMEKTERKVGTKQKGRPRKRSRP